jgi:hypothetical protein
VTSNLCSLSSVSFCSALLCSAILPRGSMLGVRRSTFDVRRSMFDVRCSMFDVRCSVFGVRCSMFDVRCSMFDVRCSMFGVRCSMFGVRCSVFGVRCSVFGVWCLVLKVRPLLILQTQPKLARDPKVLCLCAFRDRFPMPCISWPALYSQVSHRSAVRGSLERRAFDSPTS